MDKQSYLTIPNDIIYEHDEYELITYISLLMNRQLMDTTIVATSIMDICRTARYSCVDRRKNSYYSAIKGILEQFQDNGWITEIIQKDDRAKGKINPSELFKIKLGDFFFPETNYTSITIKELNAILNCPEYKSKASLVRVFLYAKSFMQIAYTGGSQSTISAYYVVGDVAANALQMSRNKYDLCINVLCGLNLLICHQTGSYHSEFGIRNAPNIYVLNNEDAQRNIQGGLSRLKYKLLKSGYGNKDKDFMPIVYNGKAIKKKEKPTTDNMFDDDEDYSDWGLPNPMNRY